MIQNIKYRFGNQSIYFQLISNIITEKLENEIGKMNEKFIQQKRKEELNIKHINLSEEMCNFYIPIIKDIIHDKSEMWGKMQKGFLRMDQYQREVLILMRKIEQTKNDFLRQMRKYDRKIDFSCCLAIKKLKQLFYLFILNDGVTAFHLDEEIIELRKRDAFSEKDTLTNENLIKKNIVSLTISISQNLGMIKSKKDLKTAQFFGFSEQEFQKINKINELMPHFIEKNHDNMIKQFMSRGTSQYIKSFLYSFCVNSKGYVMPVKVYTDFSFLSLDDFYIRGIILKANKGSQYIVFDRSGKIVGITEKLAQRLFIDSDIMKILPPAEQVIKYLNAFLLFPQIITKLQKKKKYILQNYEQQHTDIVLQSDKGYFYFDTQLISQYQQFSNYLEKKSSHLNKSQSRNLEKSNKLKEIHILDVLSRDSIRKYHKFIKSQAREQSLQSSSRYTLAQSVKNQSSYSKNRGTINITTNNSQSFNTQFLKSIFKIQKQNLQRFFKFSFKYTLSYHTLPLISKFDQNTSENNSFFNIQTNQREIYFSLQLDDSQLKENQKQIQNQHENSFQENLANYIMKLSCIPTLDQLNKSILQQSEDEDVLIKEQSSNIDRKIPKSFLKFLDSNAKSDKKIQKNLETQSENSKREKQQKNEIKDSENQTGSIFGSTSNSESESSSEDQSFGEDIYNYKTQEGKNVIMQKRISEKFQNIQTKLDDLLDENEISVTDMLAIDSYYKAKRVILQNSNAGNLISALEAAIAEELFELKKEKQIIKNLYKAKQNSSDVSIDFQNSINQNEGQITFRNMQSNINNNKEQNSSINQRNHFKKLNSDISGLSLQKSKQQLSNSLQLIQDKIEQISHQDIDPQQENIEYSNIILRPQQSSYVNISHRFNVSQENLTTHNLNQTYQNNHINISSRPLVSYSKEISSNILDQASHTSFDVNKSPKKQRSFLKQISSIVQKISENQNLRNSTSKKQSFIQNSTVLACNSELQNDLKIKFVQNSQLEQDLQHKSFTNLHSTQQINSNEFQNQLNISDSSKLGAIKKTNISKETHEDVMNNLLNNVCLIEGQGERVSIHSSSRSSSSQVGLFLKEIIQKGKVPSGAKSYSILLIIFTLIFIGLNLTNLFIIQNDMQTFSESSIIIRSPRKLLRNYAKSLYGKYILLQLQTNYLKDTSDNYFQNLANQYLEKGATDYVGILQQQSTSLIQYLQKYQKQQNSSTYPFQLYNTYISSQANLEISLFFESINYDLICNQLNYTQNVQNNCFTTLRANFFTYSTQLVNFVQFVVDVIETTAINLILKFTYISVAAIISVVVIPLCAMPFAKNINTYVEKILMIVSRIYYSQSQIERQKLHICQQLIQLDDNEYLKYNYNEVFSLRYKMFDHSIINNMQQIQTHQASKRVETFQNKEYLNINLKNQKLSTPSKLQSSKIRSGNNQSEPKQNLQKNYKNSTNKVVRNALEGKLNGQNQVQQRLQSNYNSDSIQNKRKDYILQSRIQDQKLSIVKRIQSLLIFMTVAIVYFLVIIIYLNLKSSYLQQPVEINRKTNLLHVNTINYLISSEFLAFDLKLKKVWSTYQINDLQSFYDISKSNLNNIQEISNNLTETIYGDSPYTPETEQKMKNLIEGYVCPYMTTNNCTGDLQQLTSFGIKTAVSQFFKIHNSFLNVFDPNETPDDQLKSYLNAQERVIAFTNFFKAQDEVFDIFSSTANLSITDVSNSIQQFLQNFLIYCGCLVALLIVTLFTYSIKNLYRQIQLTNFFLIFIPEEKLLEEVTLQMLKNIQKM
ncbi:transmembrane protein, putative (macronuclear) [Tetrahymena thermophila SB210]|uniref:Transmembrane protein, putative n=1 Tax=Tetrahymena thermophila (strain SB210) TaxID=312017 RepID=Q22RV6_TETTS|nr:transmembrane protein, putative [Tetrahymena thermophila SB210]EAR88016.2 transmembrane protein, putative [Tetrahymena thermophila SB210]|eukprot:XP_001008261.2 transmembrane protein, putative [Tetrahymena thermophila SB210]